MILGWFLINPMTDLKMIWNLFSFSLSDFDSDNMEMEFGKEYFMH